MRSSGKIPQFVAAVALTTTCSPSTALALPLEGLSAPNARVEDADGRKLEVSSLKGKPALILYEDKDSAAQNQPLKEALSKLASGDKYKTAIALAAIADVSGYDWWPAKGFVKDAIREESKKQKTTIYCDWDGSFRKVFGMKPGVSNVILLDRSGRVLFSGSGALAADARKRLINLLSDQLKDGA